MKSFSWPTLAKSRRRKQFRAVSSPEALENRTFLTADMAALAGDFGPDAEFGDDQHSADPVEATDVELDGTPIFSHIDSIGDVDVFQFHPESDGTLTLTGVSFLSEEPADDDEDMSDHLECAPDSEPGDDIHSDEAGEDATELNFDHGYADVWSHIDFEGDVDVFQFTAGSESVHLFGGNWISESSDVTLEVVDAGGEIVGTVGNDGSVDLTEGADYFLRIAATEAEWTGEYFVSASTFEWEDGDFEGVYGTDSEKGEDPHADTLDEAATEISTSGLGDSRSSYIDVSGDVDVFRFTTEDDTSVSAFVWLPAGEDYQNIGQVELLNANGESIAAADELGLLTADVSGGAEYFVRVSANGDGTGAYSLSVGEFDNVVIDFPEADLSDWGVVDWFGRYGETFDWSFEDWSIEDGGSSGAWSGSEWSWDWSDFDRGDSGSTSGFERNTSEWNDAGWGDLDWEGFEWNPGEGVGSGVDVVATFEVLNADGEVIGTAAEDGELSVDLTAGEIYFLRVSGGGTDFAGTYLADLEFDAVEQMDVEIPETSERVLVTVNKKYVTMKVGTETAERMRLRDTEKLMVVGSDIGDNVVLNVRNASAELEVIELDASAGNDRVRIKSRENAFEGGIIMVDGASGRDRLNARDSFVAVELRGGDGNDILTGSNFDDILMGEAGRDKIRGRNGFDFLDGGFGNDSLMGGRGNDMLTGGEGEDLIDGERGRDMLTEYASIDGVLTDSSLEMEDAIDQLFRIERSYMTGDGDIDTTGYNGGTASSRLFNRLMTDLFS